MEIHLAPRRDVPDLPALTADERDDLALAYLRMLEIVDRFFPTQEDGSLTKTPYIAAWHQAPVGQGREDGRLHLQLF